MSVLKHRNENGEFVPISMPLADMGMPVVISVAKAVPTSTTYADTGVTFTVPANSLLNVTVGGVYGYGAPLEIGIKKSDGTGHIYSSSFTQSTYGYHGTGSLPYCAYVTEETTFHIWAKYTSATNNAICANGYYITVPETVADMSGADNSSLVHAINEVSDKIDDLSEGMGTLSNLATPDKSNLVNAVNELADCYIVEKGTSGAWKYRKWSNGDAECWGTFTSILTGTASNVFGHTNTCNFVKSIQLPAALFVDKARIIPNIVPTVGTGYTIPVSIRVASVSSITVEALSNVSGDQSCVYTCDIKGTWK